MRRTSSLIPSVLAVVWLSVFAHALAWAEEGEEPTASAAVRTAPPLNPRDMGLPLPKSGKVEPGHGKLVMAPDEADRPAVSQLLFSLGKGSVVMLPSGRLKAVPTYQAPATERPFVPMPAKELLDRLQAGIFKKFKGEMTDHYVYIYACNDAYYEVTRDILESLYSGVTDYLTQWKVPFTQPQVPLVVLIMPDRPTFDAFQRMPPDVMAYYSGVSNFIVLYEDPELSDAAPELALKQAAYTIAHEGVHQILHNVGVQQRLAPWPAWLSEGLPELFCPVKISSAMVKEGSDSMPRRKVRWKQLGLVNDLRMYDLLRMKPRGGELIDLTVHGEALASAGYAVAWGLCHYLITKQGPAFKGYMREISDVEPLADLDYRYKETQNALFEKYFGHDYAKLEADVGKYLTSAAVQANYRDPLVYQTHYVVVHNARRGKKTLLTLMITTSPDGARKWKEKEEKNQESGMQHAFRTQSCESLKQAEALLSKIGKR